MLVDQRPTRRLIRTPGTKTFGKEADDETMGVGTLFALLLFIRLHSPQNDTRPPRGREMSALSSALS